MDGVKKAGRCRVWESALRFVNFFRMIGVRDWLAGYFLCQDNCCPNMGGKLVRVLIRTSPHYDNDTLSSML
jgi:hypothetical protein